MARSNLIIIEGADGTGKSTLLKKLEKSLGREARHTGGPSLSEEQLETRLQEIENLRDSDTILDRCSFVSEIIYEEAEDKPKLKSLMELQSRLVTLDPVIIFCELNDIRKHARNISREQKSHKSAEYIEWTYRNSLRISQLYRVYFTQLQKEAPRLRILHYDFERFAANPKAFEEHFVPEVNFLLTEGVR